MVTLVNLLCIIKCNYQNNSTVLKHSCYGEKTNLLPKQRIKDKMTMRQNNNYNIVMNKTQ